MEKITQSLAGRVAVFHLMPFGLCELDQAGFIVYLLKPHYKNFNKRLVKQSKLYFFDTGLLCSLLEEGGNLKAIEIKSGETINSDFFKGLKYFGNLSRLSKENLFLIYGGLKNYRRTAAKVLSWKNYREIAKP